MMAEENQILNKVLVQIAEEQNFVNYNFKIEPVTTGGANYTSTLYNVTVNEHNDTHHMFVKIAAMREKFRSNVPNFYRTEIFVYTELMKVYDSLQDENEVLQEYRLKVSKFYGYNSKLYEETVVLEDLTIKGYQAYDRFKSIDWKYAASAMTELSKMHALSFAYSVYHPEEFTKVLDNLKIEWTMDEGHFSEYFDTVSSKAIKIVHENVKHKLKSFFEIYGKKQFPGFFKKIRKPVLIHGDFRPSNLMHRIRNAKYFLQLYGGEGGQGGEGASFDEAIQLATVGISQEVARTAALGLQVALEKTGALYFM